MTTTSIDILFVGSNRIDGEQLTKAFEAYQTTVQIDSTTDPDEVMDRLETSSVDCIICAGQIHGESCLGLIRSIRTVEPSLPVVLLTKDLSVDRIQDAIDAGVSDFFPSVEDTKQAALLAERITQVVNEFQAMERLEELERINTVIRDLNRELVHATTTDELDRRVCTVISDSEPYRFAWIGEHDPDTQTVYPRESAGIGSEYLEQITITTDASPTAYGPTGRAIQSQEMQISQDIEEDPTFEPWRDQALELGFQSSAAIPLVYDGTLYGVLNIYANRPDAFNSEEQALLDELGDTIARALYGIELYDEARRFQRATEQAADAIFMTDIEGTIEYVNPAFEKTTGFSSAEAVGENPRILKSGKQGEEYYETMWGTILRGEIWESDIINKRSSGEEYYAEQTIAPLQSEEGEIEGFIAIQRDITDKRQHEIHLKKAQSMADMGSWYIDIETNDLNWSDEVYEIFQVDQRGSMNYDKFLAYVHPEDREVVNREWSAALNGEPYDIEHRIITDEDTTKWVRETAEITYSDDGKPLTGIGIVQDITERKQRERALEETKEQYKAVIENVHDGLAIVQDERIQLVNPRISQLSGYPEEALVGEPITEFLPDAQREMVMNRYRARVGGDSQPDTYETELTRKNGENLPVEFSVGVFTYAGEPATVVAIRDISDRIDRTRQLQVLDRVLRHNLRNDMTTILGHAEAVKAESDAVDEDMDVIITLGRQLMETVDKQREIVEAIAEQVVRDEVDVVAVCDRIIEAARDNHPHAVIECDHPTAATALASAKLHRALEELIENAIIHNDSETPTLSVTIEQDGEAVVVRLADNGPGIPEEEVNVLTHEYEVQPLYHGSGLGLWLVNWIVRRSGGTLDFEQNEPQGSIVSIELQAAT